MTTHPLTCDPHQLLVEMLDDDRKIALVTVLKDAGSTPRKAGTKAIVDADGNLWGTIGGGLLEADARRAAVEAIRSGVPSVFDFHFSGASAAGDDPVCGGTMRVLVDPTVREDRRAYDASVAALRAQRRGILLTLIEGQALPQVSVTWLDDGTAPDGGKAAEAVERARADETPRYFSDGVEGLAEPVVPVPLLLIAGGGHVAQALARQAALLGWRIVAVDDREQFADKSLYPPGIDVRRGRFRDISAQCPLCRDTFVAIVGRGHKVDADALSAVIGAPVGYVGMMGSRRKVELLRREFVESGAATEEQFARVHAPIGLDIGAQTVEEIAASIVAEVIAVRRGKRRE